MPTPLLLAFDHVTVRHLQRILFQDLTFAIEPGQHWALVGPGGAGKSALLAALAGQLLLTGGAGGAVRRQSGGAHLREPLCRGHSG